MGLEDDYQNPNEVQKNISIEVFDFSEYLTKKTGLEDPFPDTHNDPNEESPPRKMTVSQQNPTASKEEDQKRRDEEENARLRSLVSIPYLPPLDKGQQIYTLVLDLDETLIHFECDEEDQEEDE